MRGGGARQVTGEAWVGLDLDLKGVGAEARVDVEGERRRVIEGTGVHPEALDRLGPREGECGLHQGSAEPLADRIGREPEEGQLALARFAEVELEQAGI